MDAYIYIILLALLIIVSHIFNIISFKYKIPIVILLISTGYLSKVVIERMGYKIQIPLNVLQVLGTLGLVLIVLEGAIELKIERSKLKLIGDVMMISFILLVISIIILGAVIKLFTGTNFINAIIYAVPLSIISSAVVISSVSSLEALKKEFMIYESIFSDIMGILAFNFLAFGEKISFHSVTWFLFSIIIMIILSIIASAFLIFIMGKAGSGTKIVMIISSLLLLYSIGKIYHFSSLILILVFGVILKNFQEILEYFKLREKTTNIFNVRKTLFSLRELSLINGEIVFLIRTLFFVIFGFTIELHKIFDFQIILLGTIVVILIYIIRYYNLKMFLKTGVFPEITIAPRGLITILLYYSIPAYYKITGFNEGVLFFIIVTTSIVMMSGLIMYKPNLKIKE